MYPINMQPTYDLKQVKALIRSRRYRITLRALTDAQSDFDFDEARILEEILNLTLQELDKTMPSDKMPDLWQDVYKKRVMVNGKVRFAYIKLNIITPKGKETAVVISFHKA
jgi:hypothetical protein